MAATFENESVLGQVTGLNIQQENQRRKIHRQQHRLLFDGIQALRPLEGSGMRLTALLVRCVLDSETCSIYKSPVQLLSVSQT